VNADILRFPDGGTYPIENVHIEADLALEEAASAAYVDECRRAFDTAVDEHCARFGFDLATGEFTS
jgi:hypothetical protein